MIMRNKTVYVAYFMVAYVCNLHAKLSFSNFNIIMLIASAARSNDNAYAYRGNSGELHSRQAKMVVNLQ